MRENVYEKVRREIQAADAVLIGASNGLSISDGYHIFVDNQWFRENFGDFREKYGIRNLLQGMFLKYPTPEEQWGFFSRLACRVHYSYEASEMMQNLYELVKDKDYFVVTSNGEDHFTPAGFSADRIFEMEGKVTEYRCSAHCHDTVYDNREDVLRMAGEEKDGRVPTELLPHCSRCGALMEPNAPMDRSFFQTSIWKKKAKKFQDFVERHHGEKLVILEFGIGFRNQMIKAPLMNLAASEKNAAYVTFNKGELYIPKEIQEKSTGIDEDIASALKKIRNA
ncbi:MAG: NAD-dependent protein deacetylase, SIR2 family [Lachnospiraceae bacterium]|nr:NAD-dependent protein deacetylase, SIR2 family [Lachnospiraceae bacterium]